MLPADSFTHISEAWGSVSWLYHIVSSSDFHNCIKTVSIDHDLSDADHIPVRMDISLRTFLALLAVMKTAMGDSAGTNLVQIVVLNIVMFRTSSLSPFTVRS